MCGICALITLREARNDDIFKSSGDPTLQDISTRLKRRGPNHFEESSCSFHDKIDLHFLSSVLHLRGSVPQWQPLKDDTGNILLWNGEIFGGPLVNESQSDTKLLSDKLFECASESDVTSIIASIKGPFAFIFLQNSGTLWFGRDIFGRRSLLWNADNFSFRLCSVASTKEKWEEVSTEGIFSLDLNQSYVKNTFIVNLHSWSSSASGLHLQQKSDKALHTNVTVSTKHSLPSPVSNPLNRSLPSDEMGLCSKVHVFSELDQLDLFSKLSVQPIMLETVREFEGILSKAVEKRVQNHQHACKNCYTEQNAEIYSLNCGHASVGVLFSGGLDSIVIACLADRYLEENEPIDLINVAFASTLSLKGSSNHNGHPAFETPDRQTGRKGVVALQRVCPNRKWNFLEVNVMEEDLVSHRRDIISHLLNPSYTVLDDSIGCALWFAAHGNGVVKSSEGYRTYKCTARVVLVGMGADEQLGGYSRHRAKFSSYGWSGLIEELTLELDRIGSRNLGRDDRIIADNGVESRYPFLDEDVVSYLNNLPVWLKMNLNYPRGVGEKLVLRLLAFKLGLNEAAGLPKKAIQFGSRIARIENSKEKGSDLCERFYD